MQSTWFRKWNFGCFFLEPLLLTNWISSLLLFSYQKDERAKSGNLQTKQYSFSVLCINYVFEGIKGLEKENFVPYFKTLYAFVWSDWLKLPRTSAHAEIQTEITPDSNKKCLIWSPCRDSVICTATGYRLDCREVGVWVPVRAWLLFSSAHCPARLWNPPSLLSKVYQGVVLQG
jgi:hypothetical protein